MIMRSVEVNQIVTKLLEIPQGGGRSIDELTVRSGKRKATFQNQIGITWFDSRFLEMRIPFREIIVLKNCLDRAHLRSEEHTSELQSHSDLVCRLLLEKKKKENKSN